MEEGVSPGAIVERCIEKQLVIGHHLTRCFHNDCFCFRFVLLHLFLCVERQQGGRWFQDEVKQCLNHLDEFEHLDDSKLLTYGTY